MEEHISHKDHLEVCLSNSRLLYVLIGTWSPFPIEVWFGCYSYWWHWVRFFSLQLFPVYEHKRRIQEASKFLLVCPFEPSEEFGRNGAPEEQKLRKHGLPKKLFFSNKNYRLVRNAGPTHSRNTWKLTPIFS